ncbi:DUF6777 domain-containing protein [Streptomyces atratus]|uniref:DUF6777 domain-containing protein n=1 Tax=Streptomyces atratus TaxID=1893 RepID=UPI002B1D167D|nr:DUF6777 domain-containing protein [Streptomyces atratus]
MSDRPPPSGRPEGPPSGPLSGPTQQGPVPPSPPHRPSGPPSGPPAGGGFGGSGGPGGPRHAAQPSGSGGGSGRPWWRSVPLVASIAAVIVAAVVLTVVLTRPDGGSVAGGEVFLQAAGSTGPDPYTPSTARTSSGATTPAPLPSVSGTAANVTQAVQGSTPGLYGGTRNVSSCDVEKQITALTADPGKNSAFASVLGIGPSGVPGYLRSLTPVRLRLDTRVTNHGYRNGAPTGFQAVLQAGTAVLVDDRGVPRVRCACGNPLLPPVAVKGSVKLMGDAWPGYRSSNVVVVAPAPQAVKAFIMFDPKSGDWFRRDAGDTGGHDKKTAPPSKTIFSPCSSQPPGASTGPCPSTSAPASSKSPSSEPPSASSSSATAPSSPSSASSPPTTATTTEPQAPVPPSTGVPPPPPTSDTGSAPESVAPQSAPESAATPGRPASGGTPSAGGPAGAQDGHGAA